MVNDESLQSVEDLRETIGNQSIHSMRQPINAPTYPRHSTLHFEDMSCDANHRHAVQSLSNVFISSKMSEKERLSIWCHRNLINVNMLAQSILSQNTPKTYLGIAPQALSLLSSNLEIHLRNVLEASVLRLKRRRLSEVRTVYSRIEGSIHRGNGSATDDMGMNIAVLWGPDLFQIAADERLQNNKLVKNSLQTAAAAANGSKKRKQSDNEKVDCREDEVHMATNTLRFNMYLV